MRRDEFKGVQIKMPPEVKTPLVRLAAEQGVSFNDAAVGLLAELFSFKFELSGRRPAFKPDPKSGDVMLRVPEVGKRKLQQGALRAGLNLSDFVNDAFAKKLGVDWEPTGRVRSPFGGGPRRAAASA